jgi:hypothetical protein
METSKALVKISFFMDSDIVAETTTQVNSLPGRRCKVTQILVVISPLIAITLNDPWQE